MEKRDGKRGRENKESYLVVEIITFEEAA